MNKLPLSSVALLALLLLCGCNKHAAHYQRFIPLGCHPEAPKSAEQSTSVATPMNRGKGAEGTKENPIVVSPEELEQSAIPWQAALALDTKTGSLCLTYQYKVDVDFPQWKNLPICKSLYEQNPD